MKEYILKSDTTAKNSLPPEFDDGLNDQQKQAVYFNEGPLLVIAGAGSGKTKTLVHRVARLVNEGIPPESILLLTFTRKSAEEMLRRASTILDNRCRDVSGGTFHSFANIILRQYGNIVGLERNFTIMDRGDSEDLISSLRKNHSGGDKRFPKKGTLGSIIGKAVNTRASIESILEKDYPQFRDYAHEIAQIQKQYQEHKLRMHVVDYDDLLTLLLKLLKTDPELKTMLSNKYRFIMVDEYQDTNAIQAEIVCELASAHHNVMVVGDDSQSIYSFRGADFKNIMSFPDLFEGAKIVTLEENYRSNQGILDLTNDVIAQASEKYSKNLFTSNTERKKPIFVETDSENHQSRFVCQKILELREEGVDLNDIAVLIRSGWHSNDLEVELKSKNIPFEKFGGFKFVETSHVKDVVAFLKVVMNPADGISWNRILMLLEGVGPKAASTIINLIQSNKQNPLATNFVSLKKKAYIGDIVKLLNLLFSKAEQKPSTLLDNILTYYRPLFKLKYDDFSKRTADLESLQTIAERYDDLESFLSEMSLEPPSGSQSDSLAESLDDEKITISTIHSAKGLEWHSVFLISAVDGFIPSFQSLGDLAQVEEERRLLYVALTRAKENLFIVKPHLDMSSPRFANYEGVRFSKVCRFLESGQILENHAEKWALKEDRPAFSPSFNRRDSRRDDDDFDNKSQDYFNSIDHARSERQKYRF